MDAPLCAERENVFALENAIKKPLVRTLARAVAGPVGRALALDRLAQRYAAIPAGLTGERFVRHAIQSLGISVQASPGEESRIPASGPLVVVANHPYGGMDGLILAEMLFRARPDVKILANSLLGRIPELRDLFILADPFGGREALPRNIAPLRECMAWLKRGGCLGVFPAGEVARFKVSEGRVAEPVWSPSIARIIQRMNAAVTPVHFAGGNGVAFHLAGLLHPALQTALLPRELANKEGKTVKVRVGNPVRPGVLAAMSDEEAAASLRLCTEALGREGGAFVRGRAAGPASPLRRPLAPASDPDAMAAELAALSPDGLLLSSGGFDVYEALAPDIPETLAEIGRLRELSFRLAGEGTGKSRDLDDFDAYYGHVFVWSRAEREVVGAYRLGRTDEIVRKRGPGGLYVSTLFGLKPGFTRALGPALEMGRSFVRPEYQKSYNALLLLWKGIGRIVAREPRYRRLFGPVSVSAGYQESSRHLISGYFEARRERKGLAGMVKPRMPLRGGGWVRKAARHMGGGVESLSGLVSALEPDGKGIPVLMRQYLKLGGEILSFSVDPDFSGVLDGLIVVDLLQTPGELLERYLGKEGLARFLAYHGSGYLLSA